MKTIFLNSLLVLTLLIQAFAAPEPQGEKHLARDQIYNPDQVAIEAECELKDQLLVLLIPGKRNGKQGVGHHEYYSGCVLMLQMLKNIVGVCPVIVREDWPQNETLLDKASVIVYYGDGDGQQGFLQSAERIAKMEQLLEKGVGFINLHGSVSYTEKYASYGSRWIGATWSKSEVEVNRGHWLSSHELFPEHEISAGVSAWSANDGWLNQFDFEANRERVMPLLWSSKTNQGHPKGGDKDIVGWAFQRKDGGRSFAMSGAHGIWEWRNLGLRKLVLNAILWTAKKAIPKEGFEVSLTMKLKD